MFVFFVELLNIVLNESWESPFGFQDYQVDTESYEYGVLHPVASSKKQPSLLEEHFEAVSDDDENSDSDASQSSDDEVDDGDAARPSKKAKTPKFVPFDCVDLHLIDTHYLDSILF